MPAGRLRAAAPERVPAHITIQQMRVQPDGTWQLTLRIQNNSYTGMNYQSIEGQLQVAQGMPVRLHARVRPGHPLLRG